MSKIPGSKRKRNEPSGGLFMLQPQRCLTRAALRALNHTNGDHQPRWWQAAYRKDECSHGEAGVSDSTSRTSAHDPEVVAQLKCRHILHLPTTSKERLIDFKYL